MKNFSLSLQAGQLMVHMTALCKTIGPRPPTSDQERRAAEYVKGVLKTLGIQQVREQAFKSQNSLGWIAIPGMVLGVLAMPVAAMGEAWSKLLGAGLLFIGVLCTWNMITAVPPFFQKLIARWDSQNVIATLPPSAEKKRRLFLIGHLDSNRQRFLAPPPTPQMMKSSMMFMYGISAMGILSLLLGALLGWDGIAWWQWAIMILLILTLIGTITEEFQPYIEGANDNATAVSTLLGVGAALRDSPLKNTEVVLLFTGCEEVPCVGMESYLQAFPEPKETSYWIDLEMVGTGNLCYVTQHGIGYPGYKPHPEMVQLASQAASKNPALKVIGKPMLILEEVANLRRRNHRAICIAGYNEQGYLPNWHRVSDRLENIEPATLERAACFTWALMQEIDALA